MIARSREGITAVGEEEEEEEEGEEEVVVVVVVVVSETVRASEVRMRTWTRRKGE